MMFLYSKNIVLLVKEVVKYINSINPEFLKNSVSFNSFPHNLRRGQSLKLSPT